jgi:hypothetical protein
MIVKRLLLWMLSLFQYKGSSTCAAIFFAEVAVRLTVLLL